MSADRILIVEDEALVAQDIRQHLEDIGYEVIATTGNGEEALDILQHQEADLIMMDIMLAGELDGIETASQVRQLYQTPVVFLTAFSDQSKLERAQQIEPYGYLIKPFDERELKSTLAMALYKSRADRQVRESKHWTDTVLGSVEYGVITVGTGSNITYLNNFAEKLLGRSRDSCINLAIDNVLIVEEQEGDEPVSRVVSELLSSRASLSRDGEYQIFLADSKRAVLNITFSQLRISGDYVDGVVIAFTDITYLKAIEAELRDLNTELAKVLTTRTEILSELNRELEIEKEAVESESMLKDSYLFRVCSAARPSCESVIRTAETMVNSGKLSNEQKAQAEKIAASMRIHLQQVEDIRDIATPEK